MQPREKAACWKKSLDNLDFHTDDFDGAHLKGEACGYSQTSCASRLNPTDRVVVRHQQKVFWGSAHELKVEGAWNPPMVAVGWEHRPEVVDEMERPTKDGEGWAHQWTGDEG